MSKFQNLVRLMLLMLCCTAAEAQRSSVAPAHFPDSHTLTVQRKVDLLFERGDFERAYFIYRNELAPAGDKYAQYMVGYMHLMGKGAPEDPGAAFAWYRLAAERGTAEFVAVRDQLGRDLLVDERQRSDVFYRELRREYSDLVVLLAAIKRDLRVLDAKSGSRLPGRTSPMTVVDSGLPVGIRSGADYYGRIRRQLEANLTTLASLGDFPDIETDPDRVDLGEIERLVLKRLESTDD